MKLLSILLIPALLTALVLMLFELFRYLRE